MGAALRESGIPRGELFVTTKLWNADQGYDQTLRAFESSVNTLGLEYVDLYLVHWPVPERRRDSWRAMETLLAAGRCRAIGVSNFTERHLDELFAQSHIVPAVNQIEIHPYLQRRELVAHCHEHAIAVEAYSPLTKGIKLADPPLVAIARELGRTPAQVLVRWSLEKGYVVLPKSAKRERIRENANVFDFELGADRKGRLDALEANLFTAWNPSDVP